jgi:hypothetical protein
MMTLTIDGEQRTVSGGACTFTRVGVWVGNLTVNGDTIPTGNVVATLSGVDMPAFIQSCELAEGMQRMRIVGGAGGVAKTAKAKHYNKPTVGQVLGDLVVGAGERLSPACSAAVLAVPLGYWTTLALPTGALLQALAEVVGNGCAWRVLYDGSLWFGRETWPACPSDVRILSQDVPNRSWTVGTDTLGIWPGTTIQGRKVDMVTHEIADSPRSIVWFAEGHA